MLEDILLAQVAQLVEQRTENPRVGGSIPPLGTIKINSLVTFWPFADFDCYKADTNLYRIWEK